MIQAIAAFLTKPFAQFNLIDLGICTLAAYVAVFVRVLFTELKRRRQPITFKPEDRE